MSTTKKCNQCKKDLELTSFKKWKNGKYLTNCILCNKRKLLSKNKKSKICKECLNEKPYDQFNKTKKSYSFYCLDCDKNCKLNNKNKRKLRYYNKKEEYLKCITDTLENIILCSRCNQKKNSESFKKRKNGEYYKQCIECNKICANNKLKNRKNKENEILNDSDISEDKKKCLQCFKIKLLTEFNKNKDYTKYCSKCLGENLKRNNKRKEDKSQSNEIKKCVRCFIKKPLSCYKITKKGIQKQCDECCIYYKNLQRNNKKTLLINADKLNNDEKQCTRCFKVKNISNFNSIKHKHCLECRNNHYEYLNKNRCEHGCLNKSACVKCLGGSVCEHKRKKSECKNCNFQGYLYSCVASRVRSALKKGSKTRRTIEYLCCDINTFRKHLEDKFVEGMNWENYGKIWHIDHIIPINYKNPTLDEVIKRLHYLNTQPLWATENISKGNRYIR